jgi:hypothetical protein
MTPEEIRAAIAASPALQALVPDTVAIAAALPPVRRPNGRTIGNGSILETVGLVVGNALLDVIASQPAYRYVQPLLEQGRLIAASPLVAQALDAMAGQQIAAGVTFTQEHADALTGLGYDSEPVLEFDVRRALFNDDGSLAV